MKKLLLLLFIVVGILAGIGFIVSSVDWIKLFKLEKFTQKTEQQLGDLLWESYSKGEKESNDPIVLKAVDSLVTSVCMANKIDRKNIKLHIFEKSDVNAFAFPGGRLAVYTGLIRESKNQNELIGVVSHELAHIQLRHVMKKLIKEIGLSVLISIATGTGDVAVISDIVKTLTSTAFDRSLEKQADIKAIDYMVNASIDPLPLADFMQRLADEQQMPGSEYLSWMSTHPESAERAAYIREYAGSKVQEKKKTIADATWVAVKNAVE
ncbi:MAG: M48 family metallopeptidase [Chitinophagaceae bacterium]